MGNNIIEEKIKDKYYLKELINNKNSSLNDFNYWINNSSKENIDFWINREPYYIWTDNLLKRPEIIKFLLLNKFRSEKYGRFFFGLEDKIFFEFINENIIKFEDVENVIGLQELNDIGTNKLQFLHNKYRSLNKIYIQYYTRGTLYEMINKELSRRGLVPHYVDYGSISPGIQEGRCYRGNTNHW